MKFRFACMLTVFALAVAVTAVAQSPSGPTATISGTVVSSSDTSLVIRTDAGTERTFVVDSTSRLPTGLTPGTRISVSYHNLDGGVFHLATVTMADSPSTTRVPPADPMDADQRPLPATASNELLLLIGGLLALTMGLGLRRATRSQA